MPSKEGIINGAYEHGLEDSIDLSKNELNKEIEQNKLSTHYNHNNGVIFKNSDDLKQDNTEICLKNDNTTVTYHAMDDFAINEDKKSVLVNNENTKNINRLNSFVEMTDNDLETDSKILTDKTIDDTEVLKHYSADECFDDSVLKYFEARCDEDDNSRNIEVAGSDFEQIHFRSTNGIPSKSSFDLKTNFIDKTLSFLEKWLGENSRLSKRENFGSLTEKTSIESDDDIVKKLNASRKEKTPELARSQYSLVSCSELTPGQLWLSLPEEVKRDPTFDSLRQLYEKEIAKEATPLTSRNGSTSKKRLPFVNSAPHLNNNLQTVVEDSHRVEHDSIDVPTVGITDEKSVKIADDAKQSRISKARHYTKMVLLLACWVFFTVIFLMYSEKEEVIRNTAVTADEVKSYVIRNPDKKISMRLELSGPFIPEQNEDNFNSTELENMSKMTVWLERWFLKTDVSSHVGSSDIEFIEKSQTWTLLLQDDEQLDFNEGERRSHVLNLQSNIDSNLTAVYAIQMRTDSNLTTPFTMSYTLNPLDDTTGVIYACVLLIALYVLIIFEVINRTMAAVLLSTLSLAVLALAGERPSLSEVISWLDMETLLLLFSMMLLVAIMAETGMFDYLAVYTFEVTKGKLWPLISLLCIITALLSTFLDNVTTVLLMTPVTIRLCEVMDLDPVPILMAMVMYSNIGGTMTPVGDPPNVIIASNKVVVQSGINFTNFTLHMSLGIVLVCVQAYFQFRYIYRDTNKLRLKVPRDIQELRHQISIWRRAADSLPHLSKDEQIVRERLERKIRKLNVQLQSLIKENSKRACPKATFQTTLQEMKDKYKIRDKVLLVKATVAISFVVLVFFLHSIPEFNRVSLGWTALLGAILLLTLADREDLEPILHRVEWSTLLFFAALFVLMEALSKLNLIQYIGGLTESLILKVDESARLAVAILILLWVSGLTSAFVDNIPLTTMMVRIVTALGSNPNLNLPMSPLVWALAFGACLGGNGTLIGASANVVCAGVAEQYGYKFTFMQFFKIGFPMMIGHLIVASAYLLLCHCAFTWH